MTTYYYLIMTQQDLLENEVFEEIFRERTNFYLAQKKKIDFWILMNPKFLNDLNLNQKINLTLFYAIQKKKIDNNNNKFFGTIVSNNKEFINWLQLRYGYFEPLEKNQIISLPQNCTVNGIVGSFQNVSPISPLESVIPTLHPDILVNKYRINLNTLYELLTTKKEKNY